MYKFIFVFCILVVNIEKTVLCVSVKSIKSLSFSLMLRSLPLENTVNRSSQLANSVRYHFRVVFTSGELGNFEATPFSHLASLTLLAVYLAKKHAENSL